MGEKPQFPHGTRARTDVPLEVTKAQVSGQRFLARRMDAAITLADSRMVGDPLRARKRALAAGMGCSVLIAVVMVAVAFFKPQPNPGDAPILAAPSGELYVRLEDAIHPVANLTSARLAAGDAAEPATIGEDILATLKIGLPVGIPDAPRGALATDKHLAQRRWGACQRHDVQPARDETLVRFTDGQAPLPPGHAIMAMVTGPQPAVYLVTATGRAHLPGLEQQAAPPPRINGQTLALPPRPQWWQATPEILGLIPEKQPEELIRTAAPQWIDTAGSFVCIDGENGTVSTMDGSTEGATAISGSAAPGPTPEQHARLFYSDVHRPVAVDTGHGLQVISEGGVRHAVPYPEDLQVLGAQEAHPAPWSVISLLPEGTALTAAHAVQPLSATPGAAISSAQNAAAATPPE